MASLAREMERPSRAGTLLLELASILFIIPPRIDDVDLAARLADDAFDTYGKLPGADKARFLRHIAAGIEAIAAEVVERAHSETALPKPRLQGEVGRTVNQLRLFAQVVEEGSWAMARIDPAQPDRKPLARADIRSVLRPIGPVAVFGSSNFPLAFSVAGGDTASALAAGNPVIVKAHSAHPGTSEMVGQVISNCVKECGLPAGTFCADLRLGRAGGVGVGRASECKSCWLYRIVACRQGFDATGRGASGAHSLLHGDE